MALSRSEAALAFVLAAGCGADTVLQLYPDPEGADAAFADGGEGADAGSTDAGAASDASDAPASLGDAAPSDAPQGDTDGATSDASSADAAAGTVPTCGAPACPPCRVDADCFLPFAPFCSPTAFFCVQCFSNGDCPTGLRCTVQTGLCAPGP